MFDELDTVFRLTYSGAGRGCVRAQHWVSSGLLVLPLSGESCIASLRTWGSWHYDSLTSMGPATRNGEKATIALAEDATDSQLPVVLCFFSAH